MDRISHGIEGRVVERCGVRGHGTRRDEVNGVMNRVEGNICGFTGGSGFALRGLVLNNAVRDSAPMSKSLTGTIFELNEGPGVWEQWIVSPPEWQPEKKLAERVLRRVGAFCPFFVQEA